jgi:hypothetical protein
MRARLSADITAIDSYSWNFLAISAFALFAAEFVKPLAFLLHELGHAAVALLVAPGSVEVIVGSPWSAIEIDFERLRIRFSPLPIWFSELLRADGPRPRSERRGAARVAGMCRWDSAAASPRGKIAVYLAGPAVTALLIVVFVWMAVVCAAIPAISAIWVFSAFMATLSLLASFDPRPGRRTSQKFAGDLVRDFPLAMAAYREWRTDSRASQS